MNIEKDKKIMRILPKYEVSKFIPFDYKISLSEEDKYRSYSFNPINDPIGLLWRRQFSHSHLSQH